MASQGSAEGTDAAAEVTLRTRSPEETAALGEALGAALPGDVRVALVGDLGTGKTLLAAAIARGCGVTGPVTSPTFILVSEHHGRVPFRHIDLYRLGGEEDLAGIGFADLVAESGVSVIEWAEKAAGWIPAPRIEVRLLRRGERERELHLSFVGEGLGPARAACLRCAGG